MEPFGCDVAQPQRTEGRKKMRIEQAGVLLLRTQPQVRHEIAPVKADKIAKGDLIPQREHLVVHFDNQAVPRPLSFALCHLVAVAQALPLFLAFELLRSLVVEPHPISQVPIGARSVLPKHIRLLILASCHSFS
ncbi:MAG: hypothetical protein ABSH46_11230 [Bryobacteraceae bacterium]